MADDSQLSDIWEQVKLKIRENAVEKYGYFPDVSMNLWFGDIKLALLTDTLAVLVNNSNFKRDIIIKKHLDIVTRAFNDILGFPVTVDVRSTEDRQLDLSDLGITDLPEANVNQSSESRPKTGDTITDAVMEARSINEGVRESESQEPDFYTTVGTSSVLNYATLSKAYNFDYTFDTFIVGNSNHFAYAAATAVANHPAQGAHPLFIYGPSGLGKTHLLYAITNQVSKLYPQKNVVYVKGEEFTNQLIDAISKGITPQFRERYRRADVLLIDDIQFISKSPSTQEEIFHTFNELYESHNQIVLASDRPPRDIKPLEERLRSRFETGLLADIQPPDYELRMAILKSKSAAMSISIPSPVLNYVSENLHSNVRQLEGAVKKIAAQSYLSGEEITIDLAIRCISDMLTGSEPVSVTVDKIIDKVSKHYGVTAEDLKGRKRSNDIMMPRHIAIYIIRAMTEMPLQAIGRCFNRDHTTVLNSLNTIETKIAANPSVKLEIDELIKEIKE